MPKLLVTVDTQYDFMMPGGALYVPGAEQLIVPMIAKLASLEPDDELVFTMDTHHPETWEGSDEAEEFDRHCMYQTAGWQNVLPTEFHRNRLLVNKLVFDVWEQDYSAATMDYVARRRSWSSIEIMGVAADYCVRYALEGFLERGYPARVLGDLTVGIHNNPYVA